MDICVKKGLEQEGPLAGGSKEKNCLGGADKITSTEAHPSSHTPPCAPDSFHTERCCSREKLLLNCEQGRRFL